MELPYNPDIPLWGIYPKKPKQCVIAALFMIAKIWKQYKCPSVDECIKKLWYIYTIEYYLAVKKKEILYFVTA